MFTSAIITVLCLCATFVWWISHRNNSELHKIPGPDRGFLGTFFKEKEDPRRTHLNLAELKKKYGPIFKTTQAGLPVVVISDYETIYKVLVSSGKLFGGRRSNFISERGMKNTGIIFNPPDKKWKLLRKISQKHLHQFGDGLSHLESVITEVAEDMFQDFSKHVGLSYDPSQAIFDTALNSIAFLITGERSQAGDPLVENMKTYHDLFLASNSVFAPMVFRILDRVPLLKYFGLNQWKPFKRFCELQSEIWKVVKRLNADNPNSQSICKVFIEHVLSNENAVTEVDAQVTALNLLFAGVATTSATYVCAVNILAHNPDIQERLHLEAQQITNHSRQPPTLVDRANMPYTRAFLFELLRYTSISPQSVLHRALEDSELHGYKIPAGTLIITNLWNLHYDEDFWKDPTDFRPDRFLDDAGDVVPADHPNRTHLMPFGAGTRVCLGESLALARIFLWITTLATRFEVCPAPNNEKSSTDPRKFAFGGLLKPTNYKVVFHKRE